MKIRRTDNNNNKTVKTELIDVKLSGEPSIELIFNKKMGLNQMENSIF